MLSDNLGLQVKGRLDATGYTELAQAALQKRLVFSMGYDNGFNDLDDFVYPYFHSQGVKNSFMLADPQLDQMLEGQRAEFDEARRQQLGYEIQRYLLDNVLAKLDWVGDIADVGPVDVPAQPEDTALVRRDVPDGQRVAGLHRPEL